MRTGIRYILGNEDLLDSVEILWQELNELHLEKSPYFKELYAHNTFEARKESLLSTARNGRLCTVLAYNGDKVVGYCIASMVNDVGEIDSVYVSDKFRKMGIAGNLMDNALNWFKQSSLKKMVVKVSVGNEEVFGFYAKYGFYPRLTELQRLSE